jgi:hypothetical protein
MARYPPSHSISGASSQTRVSRTRMLGGIAAIIADIVVALAVPLSAPAPHHWPAARAVRSSCHWMGADRRIGSEALTNEFSGRIMRGHH